MGKACGARKGVAEEEGVLDAEGVHAMGAKARAELLIVRKSRWLKEREGGVKGGSG